MSPRDAAAISTTQASLTNAANDFSGWTLVNTTILSDGALPRKVSVTNGAGAAPYVSSALTNAGFASVGNPPIVYTLLAKYVNVRWIVLDTLGTLGVGAVWLDVQNGVVGTTGANLSNVSISAADGSGYRTISVRCNVAASAPIMRVYLSTTDAAVTVPATAASVDLKDAAVVQTRATAFVNKASAVTWSQAAANGQSGYDPVGINGLPAITGHGAQCFVSPEAAVVATLTNASAFTFLAVAAADLPDSVRVMFGVGNSGVATNQSRFFGTGTTGGGRYRMQFTNDAATTLVTEAAADTDTSPHVVEIWSPGTTISLSRDGAAASPSGVAHDPGTLTPNQASVFCRPDNASDSFWDGPVGDYVLYNRELTAPERSQLRVYLAAPYGITVTP